MNRVDTSEEFRASGRSLITDSGTSPERLPKFEEWPVAERPYEPFPPPLDDSDEGGGR